MKKRFCMTIVITICVVVAIVLAIFVLPQFIFPKTFDELCPNKDSFDACKISCVTIESEDEISLVGDEVIDFVSQLEKIMYYKKGSFNQIMDGTIYHVIFFSQKSEVFSIAVSDLGKVYLGSNYYEFAPDVDPETISSYIRMLLTQGAT